MDVKVSTARFEVGKFKRKNSFSLWKVKVMSLGEDWVVVLEKVVGDDPC